MNITPAILTDSFVTLQQQVNAVRYSPLVEAVHIDIMDGSMIDNLTVTPMDLTVAEFEPVKIDFHLMVEEPMDFLYETEAIKDYLPIRRIIAQVERMSLQRDFIEEAKRNGWEVALALDLYTPLEAIDEDVWPELGSVLIMCVEAGHQSEIFNRIALEKVRELRQKFPDPKRMHIIADGGIKTLNAQEIWQAGADELAVGSSLWKSSEPLIKLEEFHLQSPK
jgi:ribulose-phosphate 3-epimerase